MTDLVQQGGKTYHQCGECKLLYPKKQLAVECETWCREHGTCNIEIVKHAITARDATPALPKAETKGTKETKREERLAERERAGRKRKLLRFAKRGAVTAVVAAAVGLAAWYVVTRPDVPAAEAISHTGLHWHPELAISIHGKREAIPASIGLGALHNPVHTHDDDNVIHLEFQGLVRKDDLRVGEFFEVWGKTFNRDQILDYRNGPEGTVKMLVNGQPNDQFENYVMQDKDKIEIRYEKS